MEYSEGIAHICFFCRRHCRTGEHQLDVNATYTGSFVMILPAASTGTRYGSYLLTLTLAGDITVYFGPVDGIPCSGCVAEHTAMPACVAGVCQCAYGWTGARCEVATQSARVPSISVASTSYVVSRLEYADGVVAHVGLVTVSWTRPPSPLSNNTFHWVWDVPQGRDRIESPIPAKLLWFSQPIQVEFTAPAYALVSSDTVRRVDALTPAAMAALRPVTLTCPNRNITTMPLASRAYPLESFLARVACPI